MKTTTMLMMTKLMAIEVEVAATEAMMSLHGACVVDVVVFDVGCGTTNYDHCHWVRCYYWHFGGSLWPPLMPPN